MAHCDFCRGGGDGIAGGRVFNGDVGERGGLWIGACGVFLHDRAILGDGFGDIGSGYRGSGNCIDQCDRKFGKWIWAVLDWIFEGCDGKFSRGVGQRGVVVVSGGVDGAEGRPEKHQCVVKWSHGMRVTFAAKEGSLR